MWDVLTGVAESAMLLAQQGNKAPNPNEGQGLPAWLIFIPIAILFYLMLMRPEKRKRQEHDKMLQNLKQNDTVVTIGGIIGTVVNVSKDYIVLRIDENTNARMKIRRSAIASVVVDDKSKDAEKEK